ncbi:TetR/AcrR family transcriptional regulator [Luteimicrobium sp. NPDC057192]|uniref:TetR/AcrR family transcriptional regulator n=1 Tax=Luteimicrobium sp. NPDC057192 TaxID=3346042 RepID=UPI00362FDBDA
MAGQDVPRPGLGLREAKRRQAMGQIQRVALDLFDAHGYASVTVEQIAAAAQVAPRSVYRYFGTKDGILLTQPEDDDMVAVLAGAVAHDDLVDALRGLVPAFTSAEFADPAGYWARVMRYVRSVPELTGAFAAGALEIADGLAAAQATARGLPPDDLPTRVRARAVVGALTAALDDWYGHPEGGPGERAARMAERIHRALDALGRPPRRASRRSADSERVREA